MQPKNRTMAGALGPIHLQGCGNRERVVRSLILEWMFIRALPEFEFGVDVYQDSVLNSLLIIIV